jgi:hypothetical protein
VRNSTAVRKQCGPPVRCLDFGPHCGGKRPQCGKNRPQCGRRAVVIDRTAVGIDRTAVGIDRTAVDFHTALRSIFTALRSFPPAVRKSSAVDLDRTGAAQCGWPSSRASPSCFETPYPKLSKKRRGHTCARYPPWCECMCVNVNVCLCDF